MQISKSQSTRLALRLDVAGVEVHVEQFAHLIEHVCAARSAADLAQHQLVSVGGVPRLGVKRITAWQGGEEKEAK